MLRALVMAGLLAVAPIVGLEASAKAQARRRNLQQCADTAQKKTKRSMFGSVLGSLGGGLLGRAGVAGNVISLALAGRLLPHRRAAEDARLQGTAPGRESD